ncbi:MAG: oxidoreductase, partial [Fervidobacterium sp.]
VGPSSRKIIETKNGETLTVLAPLGNAFTPPNENGLVLVAASCFAEGIFISRHFNTPIIVSSRTPFEKEFIDFFEEIIHDDISKLVVGDSEFITTLKILNELNIDWIFVSGSKSMEKTVKERIKTKIVFFSLNEYMGCGIGACKSCAVETNEGIKHICTDGPVFRSDELCVI